MFALLIKGAIWQGPLCAGFPNMLNWASMLNSHSCNMPAWLPSRQQHNAVALSSCDIERSKLDQVQIQKECQIYHD